MSFYPNTIAGSVGGTGEKKGQDHRAFMLFKNIYCDYMSIIKAKVDIPDSATTYIVYI